MAYADLTAKQYERRFVFSLGPSVKDTFTQEELDQFARFVPGRKIASIAWYEEEQHWIVTLDDGGYVDVDVPFPSR